jgi:hypothetical protein
VSVTELGAIGEFLGSIGVLVTLIYLGLQIRKTNTAIRISSLATAQDLDFRSSSQLAEYGELIVKANRGEALSEVEEYQLDQVMGNRGGTFFFGFLRSLMLGDSRGQDVNASNMAQLMTENPWIMKRWDLRAFREAAHLEGVDVDRKDKWIDSIEERLAVIERSARNDSTKS